MYNVPDGYSLVWQDEFDSGTTLDANNWVHEVKSAGWVNNELQNYVNHTTPDGAKVTEIKNGWGKVTFGGVTGWTCLDYAVKQLQQDAGLVHEYVRRQERAHREGKGLNAV